MSATSLSGGVVHPRTVCRRQSKLVGDGEHGRCGCDREALASIVATEDVKTGIA